MKNCFESAGVKNIDIHKNINFNGNCFTLNYFCVVQDAV